MNLALLAPIQWMVDIFEPVLVFFHDTAHLSWGLSIIALTLTIRIILFPLTYKQFKSMRALQTLAPEMKRLQEKYKDDRQRLNQEMMKFYKEHQVNPFGSCLPLLMQMPVFIGLFYMLRQDLKIDICGPESRLAAAAKEAGKSISEIGCDKVEHGSATWGFIPDLTAPATGGVLVLLLALYVGSQLLSSLLMSTTVDRNQRIIMLALPFLFVLFVQGFPAGLLVYWITTNFWTVGQGWVMRRNAPPPPTLNSGDGEKPKPARGKAPSAAPAAAGATAGGGSTTAPPPPPRKKKKRSGRRR